jgi:hypothetical protein
MVGEIVLAALAEAIFGILLENAAQRPIITSTESGATRLPVILSSRRFYRYWLKQNRGC